MRSVCADTGVRAELPERLSHPPSAAAGHPRPLPATSPQRSKPDATSEVHTSGISGMHEYDIIWRPPDTVQHVNAGLRFAFSPSRCAMTRERQPKMGAEKARWGVGWGVSR